MMTNEWATIDACTDVREEMSCVKQCNWYKGTGNYNVPVINTSVCTPTARSDTVALKEICYKANVAAACTPDFCEWTDVNTVPVTPVMPPIVGAPKCKQMSTTVDVPSI